VSRAKAKLAPIAAFGLVKVKTSVLTTSPDAVPTAPAEVVQVVLGLAAKEKLADAAPNLEAAGMVSESTGPSPSAIAKPVARVPAAEGAGAATCM
jgi:hypothetical protein